MVERTELGDRYISDISLTEDYQEVPLAENSQERQTYDEMANLYAIIVATEHLERSYALDAVDPKTYTFECKKLISQFGVAEYAIKDKMTIEKFMKLYQMNCPRAVERLLVQKIPQPMKTSDDNDASHAATVAGTYQGEERTV